MIALIVRSKFMNRLTTWTENGAALKLDNPETEEEARIQLIEKYKQAVNKLAAYEDFEYGLEDEQFFRNTIKEHNEKIKLIVVYNNPSDHPNKYVARIFENNKPTNKFIIKDTLDEIHKLIPHIYTRMPADECDNPVVEETWI